MPDLARIKRNVSKMASMNAPVEDIDGYIASEGVSLDDVRSFKTPQSTEKKEPTGFGKVMNKFDATMSYIAPQWLSDKEYKLGEYNLLGDIFERPAAAIRSSVSGEGLQKGAIKPQDYPSITETNLRNYVDEFRKTGKSPGLQQLAELFGVTAAGMAADFVTNPGALLTAIAQKFPLGKGKNIGDAASKAISSELPKAQQLVSKTIKPVSDIVVGGLRRVPQATKGYAKDINTAINIVKSIPDRFFRGGLTKPEAIRIETEYGSSNGALVDMAKNKLNQAISFADESYGKVFQNIPDNKFINIKPAIEESGRRLKRLGLITEKGNLTELGKSEIARDSTYGKLLDFYQSSSSISGVKGLSGKPSLTQEQMIKLMRSQRETLVNKEQFLFLRDKLNSLYKNKPSDLDVGKVVDTFYQSGENSGLKGLQAARALERKAFYYADKFLNKNTGDLKIANEQKLNRIGTLKPLSKQEMDHIKELQEYIGHPVISDAAKINKLNHAKDVIKEAKQWGKGVAAGAVAGEVGRKVVTGRW